MTTRTAAEIVPAAHAQTASRIREDLASGAVVISCDIPKGMGRVPLASAILGAGNASHAIYIAFSPSHATQAIRGLAPRRGVEAMTIRQAWERARSDTREPFVVFVDDIPAEDRDLLGPLTQRWGNARIIRFDNPAPSAQWLVNGEFAVRTIVRKTQVG